MKLQRSTRLVAALITLLCLLFSQLAVAAYACPGQRAPMTAQAMVNCSEMDSAQPGLCAAHCDNAQQTVDAGTPLHAPPFIQAALNCTVDFSTDIAPGRSAVDDRPVLTRTTAPPLSICHCCFRI